MNFIPPFGYNAYQGENWDMSTYQSCCPNACPTYDNCNQVVQTCNVEEVPHYVNHHVHVVNNCVKKHVNIPTYSQSYETRIINEYDQTAYMNPMYANSMYGNPMYANSMCTNPTYNQYPMNQMGNAKTGCGCMGQTEAQTMKNQQGLNNFFVPFPYQNQ